MIRVCRVSDIKKDSIKLFIIQKNEVLIGSRNGKLFACNNMCPHKGAALHKGRYHDNNLVCYMHDYTFDVCTGGLTNMTSWKKSDTWMEQSDSWRASGNLGMYDVIIQGNYIYLKIPAQ